MTLDLIPNCSISVFLLVCAALPLPMSITARFLVSNLASASYASLLVCSTLPLHLSIRHHSPRETQISNLTSASNASLLIYSSLPLPLSIIHYSPISNFQPHLCQRRLSPRLGCSAFASGGHQPLCVTAQK